MVTKSKQKIKSQNVDDDPRMVAGILNKARDESELRQIKDDVLELERLGHRGSATANERRAAELVKSKLDDRGMPNRLETFRGSSSYGTCILTHLVLGLIGLATLPWSPLISVMASMTTLLSFLLETSGYPVGLSSIFSFRRSQNLVGEVAPSQAAKRRIVLCAHLDTQRTGWLWKSINVRRFAATIGRAPGFLKAPLFLFSLVLGSQTALGLFGGSTVVTNWFVISFALVYLFGIVIVGQWAFGPFVPGANDNATGVASALALVDRWQETNHEETELTVLFTGCEESGLVGAAKWTTRHAGELKRLPTVFLNLDTLGCGQQHFIQQECGLTGLVKNYPADMVDLCHSVAVEMDLECVEPISIPTQTDGLAFLERGYAGITITSSEAGNFIPNYHMLSDRSENLDFAAVGRATEFAWRVLLELEGI